MLKVVTIRGPLNLFQLIIFILGVKSLSSLPHLSLIPPSEGVATAAVGQSLGKEIGSPGPASSKPAINHNTFYQHDKGSR